MSMRRRFCDAVEELFTAKIKFAVNGCDGCTERVVKVINRQNSVFAVMTENHGVAVASGNIDAPGSADRRGKNKIVDAFQANGFTARLSGSGVEARKDVLIVPQKIERVVVQER